MSGSDSVPRRQFDLLLHGSPAPQARTGHRHHDQHDRAIYGGAQPPPLGDIDRGVEEEQAVDRAVKQSGQQHATGGLVGQPGEEHRHSHDVECEGAKAVAIEFQLCNELIGQVPGRPEDAEDQTGAQGAIAGLQARQPRSSPITRKKRIIVSGDGSLNRTCTGAPRAMLRPNAPSESTAGSPKATAYQRSPTRQIATRWMRVRMPARPSATALTMIAAAAGPNRARNPSVNGCSLNCSSCKL